MNIILNTTIILLPFAIIYYPPIKDSCKQITRRLLRVHIILFSFLFIPLAIVDGHNKNLVTLILNGNINLCIMLFLWITSGALLLTKNLTITSIHGLSLA